MRFIWARPKRCRESGCQNSSPRSFYELVARATFGTIAGQEPERGRLLVGLLSIAQEAICVLPAPPLAGTSASTCLAVEWKYLHRKTHHQDCADPWGLQAKTRCTYNEATMSTGVLVPIEEYLNTSYSPDCEYVDG